MNDRGVGCPYSQIARAGHAQAQVDIRSTLLENLGIQAIDRLEHLSANHQAHVRHRTVVLVDKQAIHIARSTHRLPGKTVAGALFKAEDDPGMGDRACSRHRLGPDNRHLRTLGVVEQLIQPLLLYQDRVAAQQQQVFAPGLCRAQVNGRCPPPGERQINHLQALAQQLSAAGKPGGGLRIGAGIVDDQQFVIRVAGVLQQADNAALQGRQVRIEH